MLYRGVSLCHGSDSVGPDGIPVAQGGLMKPRLTAEIIGVALLCSLLFYAKCEGRRAGVLDEKEKAAIAEVEQHKKAAKLFLDSALVAKSHIDSLKEVVLATDRRIEGHRLVARGAIKDYRRLRDSVRANEPDSVDILITDAADYALENAEAQIRQLYVKTGVQDSVIAKQDKTILLLGRALSEKDAQIKALNMRIALNVKRRSSARREGWIQGLAAGAFVATIYAGSR